MHFLHSCWPFPWDVFLQPNLPSARSLLFLDNCSCVFVSIRTSGFVVSRHGYLQCAVIHQLHVQISSVTIILNRGVHYPFPGHRPRPALILTALYKNFNSHCHTVKQNVLMCIINIGNKSIKCLIGNSHLSSEAKKTGPSIPKIHSQIGIRDQMSHSSLSVLPSLVNCHTIPFVYCP